MQLQFLWEASCDPGHLPLAEAEVTLRKGPFWHRVQMSHALHSFSHFLPIPNQTKAKVPLCAQNPSLDGVDGVARTHSCGPLYSANIWKIISLFALIL